MDSKPSKAPGERPENINLPFAGIRTAVTLLPQAQRTTEKLFQFFVQRGGEAQFFFARFAKQQIFAPPHRQAIIVGLRNRLGWTSLNTRGAENTFAQIKRDRVSQWSCDGLRRANWHARG